MSRHDLLLEHVEGAVAVVTLNRPEARNAIDDELRELLRARMTELADRPDVSVIVLTGAGSAFSAGGDVTAMRERASAAPGVVAFTGWRRQRRTAAFVRTVHSLEKITIAALNGPAVGLGMDLALACDFIVAAEDAWLASAFVNRGLIPDGGGLYHLPRRIGLARTKELIFTGRRVSAPEALAMGLVDRLAPAGEVVATATEFASSFVGAPAPAIALMKTLVNKSFESTLEGVAELGGLSQAVAYTTTEHRAGLEGGG